jgi:hypothetical protein
MASPTNAIGNRATARIVDALLGHVSSVFTPFGDGAAIDLIIITNSGRLMSVQCKSGRIRRGVVSFNTSTQNLRGKRIGYRGRVDLLAIYCPDNGLIYLMPMGDAPQVGGSLRLLPPRNNQSVGVRWASDYELGRQSHIVS